MPSRGLALGCGGTLGFAWTAIALQAVERELGWDARTADVLIGTSAGAEMAALLGSGRSVDEIADTLEEHLSHHPGGRPKIPGLRWPALGLVAQGLRGRVDLTAALAGLLPVGRADALWLYELGDRIAGIGLDTVERVLREQVTVADGARAHVRALDAGADGWVSHPATWLVAADAATGARVAFGSPGAPKVGLGKAIAASWAVPGWLPPVAVSGRRYLDGGTISSVSADLLVPLELDEVIVVAPMTSAQPVPATGLVRLERVLRRRMTRGLDREIALLRKAGTRVVRIEPGPGELAAMGFNFMDSRRLRSTVDAARRHTVERVR